MAKILIESYTETVGDSERELATLSPSDPRYERVRAWRDAFKLAITNIKTLDSLFGGEEVTS